MEIKLKKADFLKGLYLAQSIADRKSITPTVANVLLSTNGADGIVCAATDLRTSMTADISAQVVADGAISVGAKHLYDIVKNLPADEVSFRKADNNWAVVKAGSARYKIVGMSDRDFPKIPDNREVEFVEVNAALLVEMINKTIFSVSTDDTRHHISGVFFESDGALLRMVSTDGHRLSKVERQIGKGPVLQKGVIIPRKGVMEVRRLLEGTEGTCDIGFDKKHLFVRCRDVTLSVLLVDAQFPPYDQVIPKESERQILLPRTPLLESLKRVAIMSSEKSWGVRIELSKGKLRIASDNPDLGEAREDLEVDYKGEDIVIGFNARYFIELLNEMPTSSVVLELSGELDPSLLHPDTGKEYVGVVMPMRI